MKKTALILFFFFISITVINAQEFHAGIRTGVAATQISGDQLSGFDKAGVVIGAYTGIALSNKFDLAMEILYIQKGSKKNPRPDDGDYVEYLLRLSYIEIPLLLQWKFSKRFTFEAGPTFGVLVGSTEEDEYGVIDQPREFNSTEFGLLGGMKVEIINNLAFNIRYEGSLVPVREHVSGANYRFNHGQYNEALVFTFQYTFGNNKQ